MTWKIKKINLMSSLLILIL